MSTAAIEINGLSFAYRGGEGVRVDSLGVDPGEQLLLIGSSGSGKSTLLHLLSGVMDPDAGTVRIGGTDIHALRGARRDTFRGRHVGMVFQTYHLLRGFSAIENVMAALMFSGTPKRTHREHAAGLLTELGIDRHDADVGMLSVGQQQRVAVARALACEPTVVLADEPTASLDPENSAVAIELLKKVCAHHNAALVCVSHDPAMPSHFDRCVRLDELCESDEAAGTAGGARGCQ